MKRFPRPLTLAILGSLALITTSAVINATHAWNSYHWERESNPFTLELGDNVSGYWDDHLALASSDWNSPGLTGWVAAPVLETT